MKQYPKTYNDISKKPYDSIFSNMDSSLGSLDNLAMAFRSFYQDSHRVLFDFIIKQVWLERKFLFKGENRICRSGNGYGSDWAFSYFMRNIVGISQKPLTSGNIFTAIPTYFKDFFPDFDNHDPFKDKEYFAYPYKHITLDFLYFIFQHHERLELLKEADDKKMSYNDFINWAANHAFCYNDEIGEDVYSIVRHSYEPYIKKNK